jgi:DNA-binding PadR family transcriptional regulator
LESFIYKHYGEVKAQIIIWWLLSSQEKEKGIDLTLKLNEESNEFIVNTPKQLYRVLLKLKL